MKRIIPAAVLFLVLVSCSIFRNTRISGLIETSEGLAPVMAHAHLTDLSSNDIGTAFRTVQADSSGYFEFEKVSPGGYRLWITAVDHKAFSLPLIFEKGGRMNLEIRLASYQYLDEFDEVRIIGDWNDFSFSRSDLMSREEDGTYSFDLETELDTLFYQLIGIESEERSVNGTMTDLYRYDGGGDYQSGLITDQGVAAIRFEPGSLKKEPGTEPGYKVDKAHEYIRKMDELNKAYDKFLENMTRPGFKTADFGRYLNRTYQETDSKILRKYLLVRLYMYELNLVMRDQDLNASDSLFKSIIEEFPSRSPYWSIWPQLCRFVANNLDPKESRKFLDSISDNHPDELVRANAGLQKIMHKFYRNEDYRDDYREFSAQFGHIREMSYHLGKLDPDRMIKSGNQIPEFELKLLTDDRNFSERNLRGKFWLIDFWASWCSPCLQEMQFLHRAYDQFHEKGFDIISISLDRSRDDISVFRDSSWPMPWHHAFLEQGFESDICRKFEVSSIPTPILVSPAGTILTTDGLRGEQLSKTLDLIFLN